MNDEVLTLKEEAILFAKEKIEDAAESVSEFLPDVADELNWFLDEMARELLLVHSEKLALMTSSLYGEGNA